MENNLLYEFEAKCIQEEAPSCQSTCPIHVDARNFAKLMANGQSAKARQILDKTLPLSCLTVFLCEGICKNACKVSQISGSEGDGVDINVLERACVLNTTPSKMMPFPSSRKKIALIGAGLSSLVLAFELNKKGHQCTIFHTHELGADILSDKPCGARSRLPYSINHDELKSALNTAINILNSIKVTTVQIPQISLDFLKSCLDNEEDNYHAVFLSYDDSAIQYSDIFTKNMEYYTPNPISLVTSHPKVLTGGFSLNNYPLYIQCIADGKRAAGSIERIMQGVDPNITREKEGSYQTKLYTNIQGKVTTTNIQLDNPTHPTLQEAEEEAKRCIDCSCLECLKQCRYLEHFKAYPKRYLREIYNNVIIIKGTRSANLMINTCTQCGLCEKICPQGLNMGTFIDIARRELVEFKRMPPTAHEFALDDMVSTLKEDVQFYRIPPSNNINILNISNNKLLNNDQFHKNENNLYNTRLNYEPDNKNYMFFSGCQLPAVLPNEVEAVYKHLSSYINVGFHFACCGIPAQWAGNTKLLKNVLHEFLKKWEDAGKPIYIFACSSCAEFFKIYAPEITQLSLWEVLAKLPLPEKSTVLPIQNQNIFLHDPCSVRKIPKTYNSVRKVLNTINQEYKEFTFSKELTRCCGNGGLSAEVNANISDVFTLHRIQDIKEETTSLKNSDILLVYCAICRERFQKKGQRALHILELLFSENLEKLEENSYTKFLKIYDRQNNRLEFRRNILKNVFLEEASQDEKNMEQLLNAIKLNINTELELILDERRILKTDILKVIWATFTQEKAKNLKSTHMIQEDNFISEDVSVLQNMHNKHCLVAYRPRLVTFWVEYLLENDGSYTIFDAYSHRMVVPGVKGKAQEPLFKSCCK